MFVMGMINLVFASGIGDKGSMTPKLQNDSGAEKSDGTYVASQFTIRAINQAYQFFIAPGKGDTSSSKCSSSFLNRIILEAFTVFLKV